jgi:hypothetical protein
VTRRASTPQIRISLGSAVQPTSIPPQNDLDSASKVRGRDVDITTARHRDAAARWVRLVGALGAPMFSFKIVR